MTADELFPLPAEPPARTRSRYDSLFLRLVANSVSDDENPNSCWTWTGKVRTAGSHPYPHVNVWINGCHHTVKAHRLMMELVLERPLLPDAEVDHLCYNTLCINPDHLREVTGAENRARRRLGGHRGAAGGQSGQ